MEFTSTTSVTRSTINTKATFEGQHTLPNHSWPECRQVPRRTRFSSHSWQATRTKYPSSQQPIPLEQSTSSSGCRWNTYCQRLHSVVYSPISVFLFDVRPSSELQSRATGVHMTQRPWASRLPCSMSRMITGLARPIRGVKSCSRLALSDATKTKTSLLIFRFYGRRSFCESVDVGPWIRNYAQRDQPLLRIRIFFSEGFYGGTTDERKIPVTL